MRADTSSWLVFRVVRQGRASGLPLVASGRRCRQTRTGCRDDDKPTVVNAVLLPDVEQAAKQRQAVAARS